MALSPLAAHNSRDQTNMKALSILTFLLVTSTAPLFAQEMPKPGPEHQKLASYAGKWNCAIEMMGQDGKPVASKGTMSARVALGGLWLIEDFEATMMGGPFSGHGINGYDPAKGKYVSTWFDSWSTSPFALEGSFDKEGKVLTMTGMGPGMDGKPVKHTLVTTDKDANTRVFEMSMPGPDGKDMKMVTITYTRVTDKAAK
jgi:hypothetical protein